MRTNRLIADGVKHPRKKQPLNRKYMIQMDGRMEFRPTGQALGLLRPISATVIQGMNEYMHE